MTTAKQPRIPDYLRHILQAINQIETYTAHLKYGGTLGKAAQIAIHVSTRTTWLYGRRREELSLDEVERIRV